MLTLRQSEVVSLNNQQIQHLACIDTFILSLMIRRTLLLRAWLYKRAFYNLFCLRNKRVNTEVHIIFDMLNLQNEDSIFKLIIIMGLERECVCVRMCVCVYKLWNW